MSGLFITQNGYHIKRDKRQKIVHLLKDKKSPHVTIILGRNLLLEPEHDPHNNIYQQVL
jgi:hypothetical protein